jgi:hypothetical protein
MQPDSQPDSNKETEALTDALQSILLRAVEPKLRPDFTDRVIQSIRQLGPEDKVLRKEVFRWNLSKFSAIAATFALAGILVFFGVDSRNRVQSDDEEWIAALSASNLTTADLPLIANLDELLEAEIATQLTSPWLDSLNP